MHVERRKSEFTSALTTRLTEQLTFQAVFCLSLLSTHYSRRYFTHRHF